MHMPNETRMNVCPRRQKLELNIGLVIPQASVPHDTMLLVSEERGESAMVRLGTDIYRQWHPTPVLLPGKSHRQRSLVGYSPGGR